MVEPQTTPPDGEEDAVYSLLVGAAIEALHERQWGGPLLAQAPAL